MAQEEEKRNDKVMTSSGRQTKIGGNEETNCFSHLWYGGGGRGLGLSFFLPLSFFQKLLCGFTMKKGSQICSFSLFQAPVNGHPKETLTLVRFIYNQLAFGVVMDANKVPKS